MDRIEAKLKEVNLLEAWSTSETGFGFNGDNSDLGCLKRRWEKEFKEEEKEIIVKGFNRFVELVKECREKGYDRNTKHGILRLQISLLLSYICNRGLNYDLFKKGSVLPDLQALIDRNPV